MIVAGPDFRFPPQLDELRLIFFILAVAAIAQAPQNATYTLSSWYRDPARNRAVGGQPNSKHLDGLGLDVVADAPFVQDVLQLGQARRIAETAIGVAWRRFGAPFQAQVESDHLHLELDF